ncbi:unnamed protein product [Moneuplotes crassus]|uniref:Uncharacterized protein n=2 Tax=Euplotes crassus TaxID=5936 RepID=A0AAD2D9J7_EUPCR|nr:unnamed protein product [Moneuplotes crassus]
MEKEERQKLTLNEEEEVEFDAIHDDSDDQEASEDQDDQPFERKNEKVVKKIKKSSIKYHSMKGDGIPGPTFEGAKTLEAHIQRASILDSLPEFELTKVERLESELKVSEQRRQKVEEENLSLHKRIKELENEVEKQAEFNKTLKDKQKEYNRDVLKRFKRESMDGDEFFDEEKDSDKHSTESKSELYDENMISFSFNQALVKYEGNQTLHSPYFEEWDEKMDHIEAVFQRWALGIDKIAQCGHESSKNLHELHKIFMEDLIAFDFSTEIVNDLYSFADMLRELASMQDSLYESVRSSLLEYIKEFEENFISKVKDEKKLYNKKFDEYFNNISKQVVPKKTSPELIQQKIVDSKVELGDIKLRYLDKLNEIIIHTKVDLIDKVCVCIYSFGSFFKQGSSLFERLEPQLHSSTKKVAARNNILKHLKLQLEKEKDKCRRDSENVDTPNLRLTEKEGFVFKQNSIKEWLLRYLIVRDDNLYTVKRGKKSERYNFSDAKLFCNIFLAKIRRSSDYPGLPVVEIMSVKDNKTFFLLVENFKEMEEWINVLSLKMQRLIENPQNHGLKNTKASSDNKRPLTFQQDNDMEIVDFEGEGEERKADEKTRLINEEVKQMVNQNICADCKNPFPEWFSLNLGVLICITCSGHHRGLSTDVSRVRSLTLDLQTMNTLRFLTSVINNEINYKVFEAKKSSVEKDRKKSSMKDFIKNKYEKRKFCQGIPSSSKKQDDLIKICIKAIEEDDLTKIYPIVCFGIVNTNHFFEYKTKGIKEKITLLHLAVSAGSKDIISLLMHNSADPSLKNSSGMSPEDLALIENKIEILELLQNM